MPYKSEKIKLSETYDKRIKLTEEQKVEIYRKYHFENEDNLYSWNSLAKQYHVSKKTIGLIVNSNFRKTQYERNKEYSKEHRPDKKTRAKYMREHRRYKEKLFKSGLII